ncbi:unnamed protein product [Closterium sp. NIES-54]
MVTTTTPGGHRVSICTCTQMGRHLATFTCQPGSSLYILTIEAPQVAGQRAAPHSSSFPPTTALRVPRPRPPPVPGTHVMTLRPSSVPLRVPLPPPPESSLPTVPDPESDLARATNPAVSHLLATIVTDPLFESNAASALVAQLVDFAAACCLSYATTLVAESEFDSPPSIRGRTECLAAAVPHLVAMLLAHDGDPDAPDIPTPRSYAKAITGPCSSQWQTSMDAEMASWKSKGIYVDAVPPSGANIVDGMWIFRVMRSSGSPPVFKARSLHEKIWLCRPPGFTGSFLVGTLWSLRRPVYGLHQAPREWYDTLRTMLAALGFAPSTAYPSLFLRTDTSLPPFYVLVYIDELVFASADTEALALVLQRFDFRYSSPQSTPVPTGHSLSAPPSDDSVELSGPYLELVGCLMVLRYLCNTSGMGLVLGGWGPIVLTGHADASWVDDLATQRSSQGYTFSLGSGSVSWRSTRPSSVLSSSCEAEIYAGAMAALELRWLTYLLTDLGEPPRSPPVLRAAPLLRATPPCRAALAGAEQRRPTEPRRPAEPRRPTEPHCPARAAPATTAVSTATADTAATAAMAIPNVLTFDAEGRVVDFDVVSPAPAAIADSTVHSQWTTRDAVACLAGFSHLLSAECAHFGQYKTANSLYDAVVARYSSPATAALSRLMLPYLFPDLAAFATVADLITKLRTSDARYRAALPTKFCAKNPTPHVHHPLLPSHPPP